MKPFDLLHTPLEGTNLIEAGAGTGKTYALTGLFLRLIVEKGLSPEQILVVTFTEAATEELRDRIRQKLGEALRVFSNGEGEDPFLVQLLEKTENRSLVQGILRAALCTFDQAAISTIHGFCRRMLHECAFESGSLFDTDLVTDQQDLRQEVLHDFWRSNLYDASPQFLRYLVAKNMTPDRFFSPFAQIRGLPDLKIIPQPDMPDTAPQEGAFRASFLALQRTWPGARDTVQDLLFHHPGLNRSRYSKTTVRKLMFHMGRYIDFEEGEPVLFAGFEKFSTDTVIRAVKKGQCPPQHPFFDLCRDHLRNQEALEAGFERRLLGMRCALWKSFGLELEKRKTEKNIQSFDDLLVYMDRALNRKKGGGAMIKAVRRKFRAALIDEFQDTDPVQYRIFERLFDSKDGLLFLIGDPKQAIYGFRGADIFTYMDASRAAHSRYTLLENWRSDPGLIRAVNTLFGRTKRPFVYEDIPFKKAVPAPGKDAEPLSIEDRPAQPLVLWFAGSELGTGEGRPITKERARKIIPGVVAGEIARLILCGRNGRAKLGDRPLREGDMAVLVRTNGEARLMKEALMGLGVSSVLCNSGNLFDTFEALDLARVLAGIAEPGRDDRIKAALATELLGVTGEAIEGLKADETGWEGWVSRFRDYHELWQERHFMRMFRCLIMDEKVLHRLIRLPDGERRITNVLHLGEVLHQIAAEQRLGMADLVKWLSERMDPDMPRSEEHLLRLESDENAVRIVTIHKSKGLEYPLVFCPFSWGDRSSKGRHDPVLFHDPQSGMQRTLDLGSENMASHRLLAEAENLGESLRLLYVALTRARNGCYFLWGRFRESETSAPAYLMHQPKDMDGEEASSRVAEKVRGADDGDLLADLKPLEKRSGGTVRVRKLPVEGPSPVIDPRVADETGEGLSARTFEGRIDRQWRISSFSSLISRLPHGEDLADRDALSGEEETPGEEIEETSGPEEDDGIHRFPKGTRAGTFLHDVLENLDFEEEDPKVIRTLIETKLRFYAFDLSWLETIEAMIRKTLAAPLDPERSGLVLSRIPQNRRLNELAFYFPLKKVSSDRLVRLVHETLGDSVPEDFPLTLEKLRIAPTRGFMKGYMDLVFFWKERYFLVDWKSNFIGTRPEDYHHDALKGVMIRECYILQYMLYVLALDQYLRIRVPGYTYDTHFGGVYYIFLRGMDPGKGPGYGVYRDRPSPGLVKAWREALLDLCSPGI